MSDSTSGLAQIAADENTQPRQVRERTGGQERAWVLEPPAVGVRVLTPADDDADDAAGYQGVSYCDAVRRAGEGETLRIVAGSIQVCGWSPIVLGLEEPAGRFEAGLAPRLAHPVTGLLLGARLAGFEGRLMGVRIIEEDVANRNKIAKMVNRAARYLQQHDPSVPTVEIEPEEVDLLDGYLGRGYAHASEEARQAVALVAETEGLPLETTYTGKAMAALLDHARRQPGSRLLFVDTFTESCTLEVGDHRTLPARFWPIFEPSYQVRCWCLRAWRDPDFRWKRCRP